MKLINLFSYCVACHFVQMVVSYTDIYTDVYRFMRSLLLIAILSAYGTSILLQKCFPMPMILRIFSTFSFFRFRLYSLLLKSFIHLELSFILGDRYGCICIHLHTTIQFDTVVCRRFCFVL